MKNAANTREICCDGKEPLTFERAREIAARGRKGMRRAPYHCTHCGAWHLGQSIIPKRHRGGK